MFKLSTPVFVKPIIQNEKQYLKIWNGSEPITIESPIAPFIYSRQEVKEYNPKKEWFKSLKSRKDEAFYLYSFSTTKAMDEALATSFDSSLIVNPTKNYIDKINQLRKEFFKKYPTKDLKVFFFDIEQLTDGTRFPTESDPIISIAWAINDEPIKQMHFDGESDFHLINEFAEALFKADPDIIAGYNICKYDIPRLMYKFNLYSIPNSIWGREDREPFFYEKNIGPNTLMCASVPGRIIYDIFHMVLIDQTLNGMSRRLKAVSKHFANDIGLKPEDIIEEDMTDNRSILLTDTLAKYNKSDVRQCQALFGMYWKNNEALADFTGAPLNRLVPLATTFGFQQILGGLFYENKLMADSSNAERYPWAFENLGTYIDEDGKKKKQKPYQGALVECFKTGLFSKVIDCDVGSLYPSLMASLRIGPDNTRIVGKTALMSYKVVCEGNKRTYYLPDTMRNWTWIVEVEGNSLVAKIILDFLKERMRIKKLSKENADEALYSLAYALKIVLNSCYGIAGSEMIAFGELGVAVLTTITGRMVLDEGMEFVGRDYVLLVDTDAVKLETKNFIGVKEINLHFMEWVPRVLLGDPVVKWEEEAYEAIYIKQMKNYLTLKKKKGKLDFGKHGIAFKGTNHTNIFNKIIDSVGYALLTKSKEEVITMARKCYNMSTYDQEDFIMAMKVGKELEDYSNQNGLQPTICRMAKEKQGQDVYVGQTIHYIKVKGGYDLPSPEAFKKLDHEYYKEIVTEALSRMGLESVMVRRLDGWL